MRRWRFSPQRRITLIETSTLQSIIVCWLSALYPSFSLIKWWINLTGCPMFLPKTEVIDKMESLSTKEKDVICSSLFHALNWFREVVNAFATQIDPEMKGKVITRLHNITELSKTLEKCLASMCLFEIYKTHIFRKFWIAFSIKKIMGNFHLFLFFILHTGNVFLFCWLKVKDHSLYKNTF